MTQGSAPWELLEEATATVGAGVPAVSAMLVYAHPDDEAIAVGARLSRFAPSLFVQVTNGAPRDNADGARLGLSREQYRAARTQELQEALRLGGLAEPRLLCLGYADKEAALNLAAITTTLAKLIAAEGPALLFTHPYEGGHADHDACCFAAHTAVALLQSEGKRVPFLVESPFYFRGRNGNLQTGSFLQQPDAATRECCYQLAMEEQEQKRSTFAAFRTQTAVLRMFSLDREIYRFAPKYVFTRPPHEGATWSETITPDLHARRFCELAAEAERTLIPQIVRG